MKRYILSAIFILNLAIPACGQEDMKYEENTPEYRISSVVNRVLEIIRAPEFKNGECKIEGRRKVRDIMVDLIDIDRVSMLVLANYKRDFSDEQFNEFGELFTSILFSTYIAHLDDYTDQTVEIAEVEDMGKGRVRIKTLTKSEVRSDIPVDYSMMKRVSDGKWSVYDVRVEGMSFVANYRSQFREFLVKKSPAELLEKMQEKAKHLGEDLEQRKIDEKLF